MTDRNINHRSLVPTAAELEQATTLRKLAARLNAVVAYMDEQHAKKSEGHLQHEPESRADLPVVMEVKQNRTATGRLRDDAYIPVKTASTIMHGIGDQRITVLMAVRPTNW